MPTSLNASFGTWLALSALCVSCGAENAPLAEEQANQTKAPKAPHSILDNVEGDWINLNPAAIRPMIWVDDAQGPHLYSVNTWGNTVQHIDASQTPVQTFRTLASPVAIARYLNDSGQDLLAVVCQHSDALVLHDRRSGRIVDVVSLPDQPADLLIVGGIAYVSSPGEDVVSAVDLSAPQAAPVRYSIPSRRPTFLSQNSDGAVFVAPMLSGNNSVVEFRPDGNPQHTLNPQATPAGILDLDQAQVGLPDEDLFWLDPSTQTAKAVVKSAGSGLFAHAFHPSGALWQLNIEQNNKDPQRRGAAAIRGEISFNRLSISALPALGPNVQAVTPSAIVNLDDQDPAASGVQYDRKRSVGLPFALTISANSGYAIVAGLLTDNLTLLDPNGQPVLEWDLPEGCIPRQVIIDPTEVATFTYCQGLNTIEEHVLSASPTHSNTYPVGYDPTPAKLREGRKVFYDASHSEHNNASCATCHIEGHLDLMTWDLSDVLLDDKGPMTTQSLLSSNRTPPHHWRGEQINAIPDFRAAFPKLLGGADLSDVEFDLFEAFILSLETPPNPHQSPDRQLDDQLQPPQHLNPVGPTPPGSAVNGQNLFLAGCNQCHTLPTGSDHDVRATGAGFKDPLPKRHRMKVAPFLSLIDRGLEPIVQVTRSNGQIVDYPRIGSGLAHAGNPRNLLDFMVIFGLDLQTTLDITNFLFQTDTGLAPSTRAHLLMNPATIAQAGPKLRTELIAQARARHCDVAVFGEITHSSGSRRMTSWVYDRTSGQFQRDDGQLQTASALIAYAASETLVALGLPVGHGRRFSVDLDGDHLLNALEPSGGETVVDFDGDGFWDGHEAQNGGDPANAGTIPNDVTAPQIAPAALAPLWQTTQIARVNFSTDELTTWRLRLTPPSGAPVVFSQTTPGLVHSAVLSRLARGVNYSAQLTVTDLGGNQSNKSFALLTQGTGDGGATVLSNLAFTNINTSVPGQVTYVVDATVASKAPNQGNLIENQVLVARAIVNGKIAGDPGAPMLLTQTAQDFCVNNSIYSQVPGALPGKFVTSPLTDAQGRTLVQFTLAGVSSGDVVDFNVEAIAKDQLTDACQVSAGASFEGASLSPEGWSMPDTPEALRGLRHVIP